MTTDPGGDFQVTITPDVDDWVPALARAADGSLLVWFAAAKRSGAPMITDLTDLFGSEGSQDVHYRFFERD